MNTIFQLFDGAKQSTIPFLCSLCLVLSTAELGQATVVGLWRFEEASGSALDSSGNGNPGELVGPNVSRVSLAGHNAMGFTYDAVNDSYVEVPGHFNLPVAMTPGDPWTIAVWAYEEDDGFGDYNSTYGSMFHYKRTVSDDIPYIDDPNTSDPDQGISTSQYGVTLQSGAIGDDQYYIWHGENLDLRVGTGSAPANDNPSDHFNTWTHYATVYDGSLLRFYINGTQKYSFSLPALDITYPGYNGALQIGDVPGFDEDDTRTWNGALDDVAVFNEALDPSEISTIMGGDYSSFISPLPQPSTAEWQTSTFGEWDTRASWDPLLSPDSTNITTIFGNQATTDTTVVNDNAVTVRGVQFDNTLEYAIAGAGSITIDAGGAGNGAITVLDAGGAEFQQTVSLASNTDVGVVTGATLEFDYPLELNGNTMTISGLFDGTVLVNNGAASGSSGTLINQGNLGGSGKITGDLQNDSGGSLLVDILGGGTLDVVGLDVTGTATLDGTLFISLLNSYVPTNGKTFTVLTASSIDPNGLVLGGDSANFSYSVVGGTDLVLTYTTGLPGDFNHDNTVDGDDFLLWQRDPNVGSLSDWETNYGNSLPLSAIQSVPEPSALVLCLVGSCALGLRRRRRSLDVSHEAELTQVVVKCRAQRTVNRCILALICAALVSMSAQTSRATGLIFSFDYCGAGTTPGTCNPAANNNSIVDEYGDRVGAASQPLVPSDDFGGTDWYNFYYDEQGEGFTPNVAVGYFPDPTLIPNSPRFRYYDSSGDLTDYAWPDASYPGPANWAMTFTADPNVDVRIDSLQVTRFSPSGTSPADITINIFEGTDPNNFVTPLWSSESTNVDPGAAPVTFSPSSGAMANSLTLVYSFGSQSDPNDQVWDWAIDNVRFSQIGGVSLTSAEWQLDGNGRWRATTNWSPDISPGLVADGNDRTAVFGNATTGTTTVALEDAVTLKNLELNHTQKYILAGTGSLTMEADSGNATINVTDAGGSVTHEIAMELSLNDDTDVILDAGTTLKVNNKLSLNGHTLSTSGSGTLSINNVVDTGGGTISLLAAIVSGSGTIAGDLENEGGIVAPGNSPGVLTVLGDYHQSAEGTLRVELGGTERGAEYDVLSVAGTASLDGQLEVVLYDEFSPKVGDEFDILDFGNLVGRFAELKLPGWITWDTSNLETEGALIVAAVPEPSTCAVCVLALLVLPARRWRQQLDG